MLDVSKMSVTDLMLEMVTRSLGARDERLNELAAEFLWRQGPRTLPTLLREAADAKNTPEHRVRVLNVINRIGPPYGSAALDMTVLLRDRNKGVREAASKLFGFDVMRVKGITTG